jgi:hypothetical protein
MGRSASTTRYIRINVKDIDRSHPHTTHRSIGERVSRCIRRSEAQLRVFAHVNITRRDTTNTTIRTHWTASTPVATRNDDYLSHWPSRSPTCSETEERRADWHDGYGATIRNSGRPTQTQAWSSNESRGSSESSRIECCDSSRRIDQERTCNYTPRRHSWSFSGTFASSCTCIRFGNHCVAQCRASAKAPVTVDFTRSNLSNDNYSDNAKDFESLWVVFW